MILIVLQAVSLQARAMAVQYHLAPENPARGVTMLDRVADRCGGRHRARPQ